MAGTIFICYRRDDAAGHAGRLFDRLSSQYAGRVFMDVDGIQPGQRWADVIQQTIGSCDVAVVLIGPRWLAPGPDGQPRLFSPDDVVRAEITTALSRRIKVVPVLMGGAAVPVASQLPVDIAPILDWQVLRVDDDEFRHDTDKLIAALSGHLGEPPPDAALDRPSIAGGAAAIMAPVPIRRPGLAFGVWTAIVIGLVAAVTLAILFIPGQAPGPAPQPVAPSDDAERTRYAPPIPVERRPDAPLSASTLAPSGPAGAAGGAPPPAPRTAASTSTGATATGSAAPGSAAPAARGTPPAAAATATGTSGSPGAEGALASRTNSVRWAGVYGLESRQKDGKPEQVTGTLQLTRLSEGRFRFEIHYTNPAGEVTRYAGLFEGGADQWTTTINRSNDRAAVKTPVRQAVDFDGRTLTMKSATESVVWTRQ